MKVMDATYTITTSVLLAAQPNPLAEKVCSSLGSTIVFMFEYIYLPIVPGAICEDAYEKAMKASYREYQKYLTWKLPAVYLERED
ncbi:MAG: hypothetical protein DRN55_08960 [Thermoplasmata archaeon]|nr:MAG: hypothetical protein DRN55_08960 [Thermoplasmata archaeon]